ncbi:MAG: hypothetical protein KDD70_09395 [Bdellovibrionales bacterium]|nr:hypothetical protein [Bdellovibrionales bacterium]
MRLRLLILFSLFLLSGCGIWRIDTMHVLVRSDVIKSMEQEEEIISKASLGWSEDGRIRVLHVRGTPYERGYQHGKLLRKEVQENLGYLYKRALSTFHSEEIFAEVYERLRPHIPQEYIDEMHGLAHGAKLPLKIVHAMHALPSLTEWGGKKEVKSVIKKMMSGELATSCSNISACGSATADNEMYVVRVLDWGLHKISKLHQFPLLTVNHPENGIASVNVGWVGFLGAVSGMNAEGITLGEMGYGAPPNETLRGKPMPFLLRDVLTYASNLADVRKIISESTPTNSFVFLMSDGKTGDSEMYIRDADRFLVFRPGEKVADDNKEFGPLDEVVFGGHYDDRMNSILTEYHGKLSPELFMTKIIPHIAMPGNFHDVIYQPRQLKLWVTNAKSKSERAAEQPYTFFDLGAELQRAR